MVRRWVAVQLGCAAVADGNSHELGLSGQFRVVFCSGYRYKSTLRCVVRASEISKLRMMAGSPTLSAIAQSRAVHGRCETARKFRAFLLSGEWVESALAAAADAGEGAVE